VDNGVEFELDLAQQHSASNEMGLESDSDYEDAEDVDSEALLSPWTQSFEELRELMIKINEFMHKRTTREGHVDRDVVPDKARVSVRYSFYWEGMGAPFDSSMLRGTKFEFETGQKAVVMGLEAAVLTMRPYEQAEFIISYKLLFGELGCPPRIKPMADALLKVEVIDYSLIGDSEAINGIPKEDRDKFCVVYPKAQDMHLHAKDCVKRGRYRDAASTFERAINSLNYCRLANDEEERRQTDLLITLTVSSCYGKAILRIKFSIFLLSLKLLTILLTINSLLFINFNQSANCNHSESFAAKPDGRLQQAKQAAARLHHDEVSAAPDRKQSILQGALPGGTCPGCFGGVRPGPRRLRAGAGKAAGEQGDQR